jgi:hypothetical protein
MIKKLTLNSDTAADFILHSQMCVCAKYRDQLIQEEGIAIAAFEVIFELESAAVERLLDITDEYDPEINQGEVIQATESAIQIYDQAIKRYTHNISYAEKLPVYHRIRVTQSRADRIVALIQKQVSDGLVGSLVKFGLPRDIAAASIESFEAKHRFTYASVDSYVYRYFDIVDHAHESDEGHLSYVCATIAHIYQEVLRA